MTNFKKALNEAAEKAESIMNLKKVVEFWEEFFHDIGIFLFYFVMLCFFGRLVIWVFGGYGHISALTYQRLLITLAASGLFYGVGHLIGYLYDQWIER